MTDGILLLLVEDEPLIRLDLEEAITEAGFEVLLAADGRKALAELDEDAARFRAVVTDIRLGAGPDGWEVGRHSRVLVPEMPVVYTSGDSARDWPSQGVPNSIMLTKPFAMAQIITAVSTLLNEGGSRC